MGSLHLALLGDPVEHSRSPAIHGAALSALGLEGTYEARRAGPSDLALALEELRDGRLHGINITMPLKALAARSADSLTGEARAGGSVNTLRLGSDGIEGHSTDVVAARVSLADPRFDPDAPVLMLGAGGAASAVLVALAGRQVFLSARRHEAADRLAKRVEPVAEVIRFGAGVAGALVINATPIGMAGESLPDAILSNASGVLDLAYGHAESGTVAKARGRGLPFIDGIEFLALQAAASFEWWTGLNPPFAVMLEAARNA